MRIFCNLKRTIKITLYFFINKEYKKNMKLVNVLHWYKNFVMLTWDGDIRAEIIAKEFTRAKLVDISKKIRISFNKKKPILICVIKDDIYKIQIFLEHYRKLGIENFVFLDNMSSDGTREFLCKQKDTKVYSCNDTYLSERRIAWINRMIVCIGMGRWYLVVDSDEFVTYIGEEKHDIGELINLCSKKGYERVQGFMIDMYSPNYIFENETQQNVKETLNYFDFDTYRVKKEKTSVLIKGGPRHRVFKRNMYLTKYPLFYAGKDTIVSNSHYLYPFYKNFNIPCCLGILHYKFSDKKDYAKVVGAVNNQNYCGGSSDYIQYLDVIKRRKKVSFYDDKHSKKFTNSNDLKQINILEELEWGNM